MQVRERTAELEAEVERRRASEEAAQRALAVEREVRKEQNDFVAMVSHEFRTPLAIIDTVTQGLARRLPAGLTTEQGRCQDIRQAARRMVDMMDEYLTLQRIGGIMQAQPVPCAIEPLIASVVGELDAPRVQLGRSGDLGEFVLDPGYFRTALRNLLGNALRHTPENGRVVVTATQDGDALVLCVEDDGPGIPADELTRVFEKYFRGRQSQLMPGAGLGLYLVARIARLHNGSVTAENRPEGGLSVTLRLRPPQTTSNSP